MKFVHLNIATEYSLLESTIKIKDIPQLLAQGGMNTCAITDTGVLAGSLEFIKSMEEKQQKPIIGLAVFLKNAISEKEEGKLYLLAENKIGWKNLNKISSLSFLEGFSDVPKISDQALEKYAAGLIAFSGGSETDIGKALLKSNYKSAKERTLFYQKCFGKDNFFLQVEKLGTFHSEILYSQILNLARELTCPLVASQPVFYADPSYQKPRILLNHLKTGNKIPLADFQKLEQKQLPDYSFKTEQQMVELFKDLPIALENTVKIAARCNTDFLKKIKLHLPVYTADALKNFADKHEDYLKHLAQEGLMKKVIIPHRTSVSVLNSSAELSQEKISEYQKRLDYEISVISKMGFIDYFLIVADFIDYAKRNNIPVGPGRGSGAGSLVAYCLNITDIDPLQYDLLFERFLNPDRVSMPDFDIDFCYERRHEVIAYVKEKYGQNHVAQVITFGTLAARAVIRDIGRVLDFPLSLINQVVKLIPHDLGITLKEATQNNKKLADLLASNRDLALLFAVSEKLEGLKRHSSTHAAGVVISDEPLIDIVPLAVNDGQIVVQFTKNYLEQIGLLKFDFLGLRNLTVLQETKEHIFRDYGVQVDWSKLNYEDDKVFSLIGRGETEGVFQLESRGMVHFIKQMKPKSLEDIIAGISLFRPGPMEQIPRYLKAMHSSQKVVYDTPLLEPILKVTYGCIVYQEQVMRIVRDLAGFSLAQSDIVRRAMSKKNQHDLAVYENLFLYGGIDETGNYIKGCINNGVSLEIGKKIFKEVLAFAGYAFNKPHAAGYSYLTYQTAWCKTYYPAQLFTALLNSFLAKVEGYQVYLQSCKKMNISILPIDINKSQLRFITEKISTNLANSQVVDEVSDESAVSEVSDVSNGNDGKFAIRFALGAVKNVGFNYLNSLIEIRERTGPFRDMDDFLHRTIEVLPNKKMLESLILAGAFDTFSLPRTHILDKLENFLHQRKHQNTNFISGQLSLFAEQDLPIPYNPNLPEFSPYQKLTFEKEMLGIFLSTHPLANLKITNSEILERSLLINELTGGENYNDSYNNKILNEFCKQDLIIVCLVNNIKIVKTAQNKTLVFLSCEDLIGDFELLIFEQVYRKVENWLAKNQIVRIVARVKKSNESIRLLVNDLVLLENLSIIESSSLSLKTADSFQNLQVSSDKQVPEVEHAKSDEQELKSEQESSDEQVSEIGHTSSKEKVFKVEHEPELATCHQPQISKIRLIIKLEPEIKAQTVKEFLNYTQNNPGELKISFYIVRKNEWQHLNNEYTLALNEENLSKAIEFFGLANVSLERKEEN